MVDPLKRLTLQKWTWAARKTSTQRAIPFSRSLWRWSREKHHILKRRQCSIGLSQAFIRENRENSLINLSYSIYSTISWGNSRISRMKFSITNSSWRKSSNFDSFSGFGPRDASWMKQRSSKMSSRNFPLTSLRWRWRTSCSMRLRTSWTTSCKR